MKRIFLIGLLLSLSIPTFYFIQKKKEEDRKNAPYIDFKSELKILVNRISFERNELYLNEKYYNANRITDYTDVYYNKSDSIKLDKIRPPFLMQKKANNDTLFIIKDKKYYHILISKN